MARKSSAASRPLSNLPQTQATWHCAVRRLRSWIIPEDEPPVRPYLALILDPDKDLVLGFEILLPDYRPEQVLELLFRSMRKPLKGLGLKPHRPLAVRFEQPELAEALESELQTHGIQSGHATVAGLVDEFVSQLEFHMREGEDELPGLLSVKGVTPELAGGVFAAAAEFYRAAPWIQLSDEHPLAITVPPERKPRFVQVMGAAGIEYGLAMYRRWEDLENMYALADDPLELLPSGGANSFLFDEIDQLPFDDLDAMEKYGWEAAGEQAYPTPLVFLQMGGAKRPSRADLVWYEAALRAIPVFIRDYLEPGEEGDYLPVKARIDVQTHRGKVVVALEYPAGILSKETRPVGFGEWLDFEEEEDEEEGDFDLPDFDPRAMEGTLRFFGSGSGDPRLDEAQDLIYQALESPNPAKRIRLAHQALSISPNCADAYVLLAEEQAENIGQALEYYQKGVQAGERALGVKSFKENEGYFWGILETRPYMRARQGLAETLWELGRLEEARRHFQEMLRLNPKDNQGIRYRLASLLLDLHKDEDLAQLLDQYEEEPFAAWHYTRALLLFRKGGPSNEANRALKKAIRGNPHVPKYLAGRKRIPIQPPDTIGYGDENEAIVYAGENLANWRQTPGAVEWLQQQAQQDKASPSGKPHKKRSRG